VASTSGATPGEQRADELLEAISARRTGQGSPPRTPREFTDAAAAEQRAAVASSRKRTPRKPG